MLEKPQNLRDALELIKMLEQLFGSISRTNEQIPWRGIELTLRQAALSIVNAMEGCPSLKSSCAGQLIQPQGVFCAQPEVKENKETMDPARFRNRPTTVVDRVQASPVSSEYKNKSFSQD